MMERQQGQKEKSVAWFKLADLIARGEREKALSVFRLLSHSLQDRAYVLQVEGDILWYLDDDRNSSEKYKQAAFLYQKEKRWVDAISIYEHLLTLNPQSYEVISTLLTLYATIDWSEKFYERFALFIDLFNNHGFDEAYLEKTIKEILEMVRYQDIAGQKDWIIARFDQASSTLPVGLQNRLKELVGR